jgi:hypothetical protein
LFKLKSHLLTEIAMTSLNFNSPSKPQSREQTALNIVGGAGSHFSGFRFEFSGFGDIAKAVPVSCLFGKPSDFKGFGGQGTTVFGTTNVVPLPPEVEARLGDENENVIFDHK